MMTSSMYQGKEQVFALFSTDDVIIERAQNLWRNDDVIGIAEVMMSLCIDVLFFLRRGK